MDIAVVDNPEAGRFEIRVDGEVAGFAAYRRADGAVSFLHTEVDPVHEGKGLGSTLVRGALQAVRGEGRRVVPHCPFVRSYIKRHPEYHDLLPADLLDDPDLRPAAENGAD